MILDLWVPLYFVFFVTVVFQVGDLLGGRFLRGERSLVRIAICTALGYGIIGYALQLLGQFGWLKPIPVAILFWTIFLGRFLRLREFRNVGGEVQGMLWGKGDGIIDRFLQVCLLILGASTFVFCFLPEIAHDSLAYHINLPKIYALSGTIKPYPYDLYSYRPLLMETLFSLAFLWKVIPLAKLVHWWAGVLLTLGVITAVEEDSHSYRVALFAGVMLFVTPLFINEVQTTYTDFGTSFFAFFSFWMLLRGIQRGRTVFYCLSGLLMGLSISTKLLSALMAVALIGAFLTQSFFWRVGSEQKQRKTLVPVFVLGTGILLGYGFWAIRNAWATGNPFFPFFPKFFPGFGVVPEQEFIQGGVAKTISNFLLMPFLLAFNPAPFDQHHYIGLIYLLALPFLIYGMFRTDRIRVTALASVYFFVGWFVVCQNYRFLSTLLPLLLYGGGCGFSEWKPKAPGLVILRKITLGIALLCFVGTLGLASYHFRDHLRAVFERWSPVRYLTFMEPSFNAAQWANEHLPSNARLLSMGEIHAFYFDRPFITEDFYSLKNPEALRVRGGDFLDLLRTQGFSHLLLASNEKSPAIFEALKDCIGKRNGIKDVYTDRSMNQRGARFTYRIFEIEGSEAQTGATSCSM